MGGIASIFTPQNSYSASAGVNNGNQDFAGLLAGTQAQTAQNLSNQNSLAAQLQAQAAGQGPNPAQQQLQNALTQNQQQAAGQEASQKGINPGLAQKQIMTTSANQAQQAAGQGALMGAQQQLAAQGQLAGLYGNMANQNLANQGQYESGLNSQNQINAGVSAQNASANQNSTSGLLQAGGAALLAYKGGEIQKFDGGGSVAPNDPVKAKAVSSTFVPTATDQAISQAVKHPIDTLGKYAGFYSGGGVQHYNGGTGDVDYNNNDPVDWNKSDDNAILGLAPGAVPPVVAGPNMGAPTAIPVTSPTSSAPIGSAQTGTSASSKFGQNLAQQQKQGQGLSASQQIANQMASAGGVPQWAAGNSASLGLNFQKKPKAQSNLLATNAGGPMDQSLTPLQQIQSNPLGTPSGGAAQIAAMFAAHGGQVPQLMNLKSHGGPIPGQAPVSGDSPKNDIVPAVLSPKEIVLPRSVTLSDNPGDKAKDFVEQLKGKSKSSGGYAKVLEAKRKATK